MADARTSTRDEPDALCRTQALLGHRTFVVSVSLSRPMQPGTPRVEKGRSRHQGEAVASQGEKVPDLAPWRPYWKESNISRSSIRTRSGVSAPRGVKANATEALVKALVARQASEKKGSG